MFERIGKRKMSGNTIFQSLVGEGGGTVGQIGPKR
jgi:hypothetical protein